MAERRRILLLEARPRKPLPIVFGTWNPLDKSAGVTLSNGNLTASPTTATSDGGVRGTAAMTTGIHYWEVRAAAIAQGTFVLQVGIASAAHTLGNQLGFDAGIDSIQGCDLAGNWRVAGVVSSGGSGMGALATADIIRNWYDADNGVYRCARNGGLWYTIISDPTLSTRAWYPIVQLSRGKQVVANFGASAFAHYAAFGDQARPGVYPNPGTVETPVYFSSSKFRAPATDKLPAVQYQPRIARDPDYVTNRQVRPWVVGGRGSSDRGRLVLRNQDGALDEMASWEWRDAPYQALEGYAGDARADFTVRSAGRIEVARKDDARNLVVRIADPVAATERLLQTRLYPPTYANPALAGKPLPIVIGPALFCGGKLRTPDLLDPVSSNAHDWSFEPVVLETIYDRGNPFAAPPTDWDYLADGTGAKLVNRPDGPVVANVIGSSRANALLFDVWNVWDYPSFPAWAGGTPSGWVKTGTETATRRIQQSGTAAQFLGDGTGDVQIARGSLVADGTDALYYAEITISAYTSGYVALRAGTQVVRRLRGVGKHAVLFYAAASSAPNLAVVAAAGATNVTISAARMTYAPTARTVTEFVAHVQLLAGLGSIFIDLPAPINAYRLGTYIDVPMTVRTLLQQVVDSFCGWMTSRRDGSLAIGALNRSAAAPVLRLDNRYIRTVTRTIQPLTGLTTRVAGQKNHRVHTDGELANSVDAAAIGRAQATPATRANLTSEYLCIRGWSPATAPGKGLMTAPTPRLTTAYVHAEAATAQETLLQLPAQIQAEANRVPAMLGLSEVPEYVVSGPLSAVGGHLLEHGQKIFVVWDDHDLQAGKELVVMGVYDEFFSGEVRLTLWELR